MILIVNIHTGAVGHYEQYPFNSYCEVDGVCFGASATGLHMLDVDNTDDGAAISAGLGTGYMKFKSVFQKRVENAYMTMRSEGAMLLTVTTDDGARNPAKTLALPNYSVPELVQRRVVIPKGLRGESWKFEINNVDGVMFDFGQLEVAMAESARHV